MERKIDRQKRQRQIEKIDKERQRQIEQIDKQISQLIIYSNSTNWWQIVKWVVGVQFSFYSQYFYKEREYYNRKAKKQKNGEAKLNRKIGKLKKVEEMGHRDGWTD